MTDVSRDLAVPSSDVSYEVALDDEPLTGQVVPVEPAADRQVALLPVVPDQWRRENWGRTLAFYRRKALHHGKFHTLRAPWYLTLTVMWAVAGFVKVIWRVIHWATVIEQVPLRYEAVKAGDERAWRALHKEGKETRKFRGIVLAVAAVLAAVLVALGVTYARWWVWGPVLVLTVVLLARYGRPADKRIIAQATVTPRFRRLSADVVLRAYYAAKLGNPDKPDEHVTFGGPMARDGEGSRVLVDLPYGRSLKDAVAVKDAIASGLDVTESQVFLHRDPTSARRHTLWVADRDPLAVPVGRTPLLACRQTDIWKPAPIGLDERGQLVKVPLMWNSVLCGALPRMGKTFSVRLLGLYAALDPYCKLHVFDPTGKPDWRKFALVADNSAFGLTPTKDGLPPEMFLATLEHLKDVVNDRYARLSELQERRPDLVPEGKLTRELARNLGMDMQVNVLIVDEFQEFLELGPISNSIAELLVFLTKVAPAAGMPVVLATQRPSGIGSGETAKRFTALRDMCAVRFSLRTPDWRVSDMVLGAGALGEGLNSSALLPEYKGVGILRGASDKSPTVRTYLAEGPDAERILVAARRLRERAGTLAGMAAVGESPQPQSSSVLADVAAVMGDTPGMHWETVAGLLRARFPDRHADATADSVSAQCRAAGVPSVDVKYLGQVRKGCRKADIRRVAG